MLGYLYIVIWVVILSYSIFRRIYLFNKGQYNPYPYREEKKDFSFIQLAISLGMLTGAFVFLTDSKLLSILTVIFLCYSICLIVCTSVLNYLSYMMIKDSKIMFQTAIFNIIIIIISIGIWKSVN